MGMKHTAYSAETLSAWTPIGEVLKLATSALGKDAVATEVILRRLRDGLLEAAARKVVISPDEEPKQRYENISIPEDHWAALTILGYQHSLWITGEVELFGDHGTTLVSYYGVLINPAGLGDWKLKQDVSSAILPDAPASQSLWPTIAPALLREWAALYLKAYQGAADTEEKAWASAQGMFPHKRVTRAAMREALSHFRDGPKKRGRKSAS